MDLRFQLTLAGVAMGIAIAVLWLPPVSPPRPVVEERAIEPFVPYVVDIPAGRRGVLLGADGAPARGVDVYLTHLRPERKLIYPAVRTNHLGHFAIVVPPGRYRVQALHGFDASVDREIDVPEATHPDIELHAAKVELFHRLLARR